MLSSWTQYGAYGLQLVQNDKENSFFSVLSWTSLGLDLVCLGLDSLWSW